MIFISQGAENVCNKLFSVFSLPYLHIFLVVYCKSYCTIFAGSTDQESSQTSLNLVFRTFFRAKTCCVVYHLYFFVMFEQI